MLHEKETTLMSALLTSQTDLNITMNNISLKIYYFTGYIKAHFIQKLSYKS
jgi:hypothetical protein